MNFRSLYNTFVLHQPWIRHTLARLQYGKREELVTLFGAPLQVDTIKEHGYYRAYSFGKYSGIFGHEGSILISLSAIIRDNDVFCDVGANVGLFTSVLLRLKRLYPAVKYYAFEANPDTFKRLEKSVARSDVNLYNFAISDHEGTLDFVEGSVSHTFTTPDCSSGYNIKNQVRKIPARRLDSFDIKGESLILKIDVEGQELQVLKGAEGLFAAGRVKAVYLDGYKNGEQVRSLLKQNGFKFFNGSSLAVENYNFNLLAIHTSRL